jgi:hypothetical protein
MAAKNHSDKEENSHYIEGHMTPSKRKVTDYLTLKRTRGDPMTKKFTQCWEKGKRDPTKTHALSPIPKRISRTTE